jgi:O-antigen/teichoic acid export membrane protein
MSSDQQDTAVQPAGVSGPGEVRQPGQAAERIVRNSGWYGLETLIEIVVFFASSVTVARYLGPQKLGAYVYINFFITVLTATAGTGVTIATRKYMMEYLALGRPGMARAVYKLAYRYQLIGALSLTAVSMACVLLFGDPQFRLMSCILIASILPGLMSWVPAQANNAFEDVRPNTMSALGYLVSYATIIALTVIFRWDLPGVASATFLGRTVEVLLRTGPVNRKLRRFPLETLEPELIARLRRFTVQGMGLQILTSVVWDRSEVLFLKYFASYQQVGFYSVSFTFTNNLLTAAKVFGTAASLSLMSAATTDVAAARRIVRSTCRFLLLLILPISMGAAAVTLPAIHLVYGARYLPAVPVMITAVLLCTPRAFQLLPETLLKAADRQNRILVCYAVTGVVNIVVDYVLIRRYAAVGAAWGNGLSQAFGVVVIWFAARDVFQMRFPVGSFLRLAPASALMALAAYEISHRVHGVVGLAGGVLAGVVIYCVLLRVFRALEPEDRDRLALLGRKLPGRIRPAATAVIAFVTPTAG